MFWIPLALYYPSLFLTINNITLIHKWQYDSVTWWAVPPTAKLKLNKTDNLCYHSDRRDQTLLVIIYVGTQCISRASYTNENLACTSKNGSEEILLKRTLGRESIKKLSYSRVIWLVWWLGYRVDYQVWFLGGARFFFFFCQHVQIGSWTHPASYPTGTWVSIPDSKVAKCMRLTTHPHQVSKLRTCGAIPPSPIYLNVMILH